MILLLCCGVEAGEAMMGKLIVMLVVSRLVDQNVKNISSEHERRESSPAQSSPGTDDRDHQLPDSQQEHL